MTGVGDEPAHRRLGPHRVGLRLLGCLGGRPGRVLGLGGVGHRGLDAGEHGIDRGGQRPDLRSRIALRHPAGQVAARDRSRRPLHLPQWPQAPVHGRVGGQREQRQDHDPDAHLQVDQPLDHGPVLGQRDRDRHALPARAVEPQSPPGGRTVPSRWDGRRGIRVQRVQVRRGVLVVDLDGDRTARIPDLHEVPARRALRTGRPRRRGRHLGGQITHRAGPPALGLEQRGVGPLEHRGLQRAGDGDPRDQQREGRQDHGEQDQTDPQRDRATPRGGRGRG